MDCSIWNKKVSGLLGLFGNLLSIFCAHIMNRYTTYAMLGNIKYHGKNILVMRGCVYRYPKGIEILDNVIIGKNALLTAGKCVKYDNSNRNGGYLIIKQNASIGNDCEIDFSGGVIIGAGSHLAHHVFITTHDHGFDYRNEPVGKALEIGENVFIGTKSTIMFNCNRIGNNAVIGTGSIVTKDVPDNAIVAGNPARIIKYRNDV